jgi:hypothetical protein
VRGKAWNTNAPTLPGSGAPHEVSAVWPERDAVTCRTSVCFLQPLRCSTKLPLRARLQANKLTFEASVKLATYLPAKRCRFELSNGPSCGLEFEGVLVAPPRSRAFVFVLLEMPSHRSRTIVMPNV